MKWTAGLAVLLGLSLCLAGCGDKEPKPPPAKKGETQPARAKKPPATQPSKKPPVKKKVNVDDVLTVLEPFVNAKKYNPNNSTKMTTTRTMAIRAIDIAAMHALYTRLGGK